MTQRFSTVLLIGGPGSGKGTHGKMLGALPGFLHISSGDVFRGLRPGSAASEMIRPFAEKGLLAPDDITKDVWLRHMQGLINLDRFVPEREILVSDGIPRTAAQARMLEDMLDVRCILHLELPEAVMQKRILGRAQGRADDQADVVNTRVSAYKNETLPLLEEYDAEKIVTINSDRPLLEVAQDVLRAIAKTVRPG